MPICTPHSRERGSGRVNGKARELGPYSITTQYAHTPKGRERLSAASHFPFPDGRNSATPTASLQNPATHTRTSLMVGAAEPRVFQARSPEKTGRVRWGGEAFERSQREGGLAPLSPPEDSAVLNAWLVRSEKGKKKTAPRQPLRASEKVQALGICATETSC